MKKSIIILLAIVPMVLGGCSTGLTNEQIITEKNKCLSGGMDYTIGEYLLGGGTAVVCIKPEIK